MNADVVAGFRPKRIIANLQAALDALPECRNDLEYSFASDMCIREFLEGTLHRMFEDLV